MGRDTVRLRYLEGGRNRHGAGDHRLLPPAPGALQSAQDRGLRTTPQDLNGQAAEVQAARTGEGDLVARSMFAVMLPSLRRAALRARADSRTRRRSERR